MKNGNRKFLFLLVFFCYQAQAQELPVFRPSHEQMLKRYKDAAERDSAVKNTIYKANVNAHWLPKDQAFWYVNILKDSVSTDIVTAIKAVAAGEYFTSPALTSYLINRQRPASEPSPLSTGLTSLTPTERRVLSLIAAYKTSKEIAEE